MAKQLYIYSNMGIMYLHAHTLSTAPRIHHYQWASSPHTSPNLMLCYRCKNRCAQMRLWRDLQIEEGSITTQNT